MTKNKQGGTIIFTGATASIRGSTGFCAFASAKHGLRSFAQSMAKELASQNIHVAHVLIDGAIDTPWIRHNFPLSQSLGTNDGLLLPDAIANNYYYLHTQARNAWSFELDLRPWIENW